MYSKLFFLYCQFIVFQLLARLINNKTFHLDKENISARLFVILSSRDDELQQNHNRPRQLAEFISIIFPARANLINTYSPILVSQTINLLRDLRADHTDQSATSLKTRFAGILIKCRILMTFLGLNCLGQCTVAASETHSPSHSS